MSKFQNPLQKGTEVFPQVVVGAPIVRVFGFEKDAEGAQKIINAFQGLISHFHKTQRQNYSLSTVEYTKNVMSFPEGRMSYTNMQGQELIMLEVDPKKVEELLKKEPKQGLTHDWLALFFYSFDLNAARPYYFPMGLVLKYKLLSPAAYKMPSFVNAFAYVPDSQVELYYQVMPYIADLGTSGWPEYVAQLPQGRQSTGTMLINLTRLTEYATKTEPIKVELKGWWDGYIATNVDNAPAPDVGRPVNIAYMLHKGSPVYSFETNVTPVDWLDPFTKTPKELTAVALSDQPDTESITPSFYDTYPGSPLGSIVYTPPPLNTYGEGTVSYVAP